VLAVQLFFTVSDVSARDQIPESGIRRGLTDVEWRQVMQQIIIYRETYLKALHPEDDDCFGISVAISGDTLVVGAYGEDTTAIDSGAVYVFVRTGSTWTQEAFLKASNVDAYDFFGCAVAVSGDTVVVGAHGEDSNGTEADTVCLSQALPTSLRRITCSRLRTPDQTNPLKSRPRLVSMEVRAATLMGTHP
jgi:hypothetical protein